MTRSTKILEVFNNYAFAKANLHCATLQLVPCDCHSGMPFISYRQNLNQVCLHGDYQSNYSLVETPRL